MNRVCIGSSLRASVANIAKLLWPCFYGDIEMEGRGARRRPIWSSHVIPII